MGRLSIVEKGKPLACQADWPLFYMNDFSRLGLAVMPLAEAVAALRASGYQVMEDDRGIALRFDGHGQLAGIFAALSAHRVTYELTDLVGCVYQG